MVSYAQTAGHRVARGRRERRVRAAARAPVCTAGPQVSGDDAGPLKFAVIGDNGTGEAPQIDVGRQMASARNRFPFELVVMLGDNLYGRQQPQDFVDKFERPYAALLGCDVKF
jgi:hypothetical protein